MGYVFEEYEGSEQIIEMIFSQSEPFNFKLPKPKSGKVVPQVFQKNWWTYFRYRKKENSKIIDHGIIGGILFYNQRKNAYKRKKSIYKTDSFRDESGLFWSQKILNWIHLSVSWIIIGHNIWFTKRGSSYEELYKSYGLEGLITDNPKISLKRYPLLFLLSLVDSIDPVKQFAKYNNNLTLKEILNNLEFDFSCDSITISSEFEDNEMTKRYIKEVSNLDDWLRLDYESTEKSVILSV